MNVFPTKSKWWKATIVETDEGVTVELWKLTDVTGNVWALMNTETFPGPFHLVLSHTADWLDTLPVNAGPVM